MWDYLLGLASPFAYLVILFLLVLCGIGSPIPEDTILIASGYLAYNDVIELHYILPVCYVGVLLADSILYFVGHRYGQKIIAHPRFLKLIPENRVNTVRRGFHRWGGWMIFFARFLIGFRAATFILSGVMNIRFKKFILFDMLGGVFSVPLYVGLGYLFATHIDAIRADIGKAKSWIVVAVIIAVLVFIIRRWIKSRKDGKELDPIFLWEPRKHEHSKIKKSVPHV